jgi:hypothetical protein
LFTWSTKVKTQSESDQFICITTTTNIHEACYIALTVTTQWTCQKNHKEFQDGLPCDLNQETIYAENLTFICPCNTSISLKYNQQDAMFSRYIYFYKLLYMFQAVPPPIIRSTKLYIQRQFHLIHDSSRQQYWFDNT